MMDLFEEYVELIESSKNPKKLTRFININFAIGLFVGAIICLIALTLAYNTF
jgi:uncharacterized membrane protein